MAIVAIVLSIDLARAICIVQKMLDDSRQILVGVGKIIGGRMHVVTPCIVIPLIIVQKSHDEVDH